MDSNNSSRRNFLKMSALASGAVATTNPLGASALSRHTFPKKSAREIWVAVLSLQDMRVQTPQRMMQNLLDILNENIPGYPCDIVCLPEVFPFSSPVVEKNMPFQEKVDISTEVMARFSDYARQNNCYVICPVYIEENGHIYNSAVVFGRKGSRIGDYKKIYLTTYEIEWGLTPGPVDPPVFETDFGTIGIQICYDINWEDGWTKLSRKGAELVFWPSGYAAGKTVNNKAWQHRYFVASSTWKDSSKICDMTGDILSQTGRWSKNFICAPVNLEKAFLHSWPNYKKFPDIVRKYGHQIQITTYHEEEWSIIESLSPDISIVEILKEFDIPTYTQELRMAEAAQKKNRVG